MNESILVFHGELFLYSNLHTSPFWVDGVLYKSAEHYIQFGDSAMTNQILRSDVMIDTKRLSYNITDFNPSQWINEGFKICNREMR